METAAKGCPLCMVIVEDPSGEYSERLMAREEIEVRKGEGNVFELSGAVKE